MSHSRDEFNMHSLGHHHNLHFSLSGELGISFNYNISYMLHYVLGQTYLGLRRWC